MESKIQKNADGSWDLSEINNVADLDNEIAFLKNKVNTGFQRIKSNTTQIPRQAVRTTVGKAFPFLNKNEEVAAGTAGVATSLLGGLVGIILNKEKGTTPKARLANTAKGIGITAAIQGGMFLFNVINKWNQRRKARKEMHELKVKTEVLKLLKEDLEQKKKSK